MSQGAYKDKARGMLVGLAVGDALGAPVEFGFKSWNIQDLGDKIEHLCDYAYPAGSWTDDTSMALCIADSLLERHGYDSYDMMDKYVRWFIDGYRSSVDHSFGIGQQTSRSLFLFNRYKIIPKGAKRSESAGNGAIMRLAPIVIANTFENRKYPTVREIRDYDEDGEWIEREDIEPTLEMARLSCRETHNSIAAEAVTEMFATNLYCALHGLNKQNIAAYSSRWIFDKELDGFILNHMDDLVGRALNKNGTQLSDLGGYIVDCFSIALWGLLNYDNFKDGMLAVIRLGGDTDTNAACYGQLAGAYYGYNAIPKEWRDGIYDSDEFIKLADELLAMKECPVIQTRFEDDINFLAPGDDDVKKSEEYYTRSGDPISIAEIMKQRTKKKEIAKKCPKCGNKLAPIVYGEPTVEAAEAIKRHELFPGGCSILPGAPDYHCYHCVLDFDKNLEEPKWQDALNDNLGEDDE